MITSQVIAADTVSLDFTVTYKQVLIHDFSHAQLAQMFCSLINHVLGRVFPTHGAGADEFDYVVCTLGMNDLLCHGEFPLQERLRELSLFLGSHSSTVCQTERGPCPKDNESMPARIATAS